MNKYTGNGKFLYAVNYMTLLLLSLNQKRQTQDPGAKIEPAKTPIWHKFWTFNYFFTSFTAFPANKDLPHGHYTTPKGQG